MTAVPRILFRFDVEVIDVIHQVLQGVEEQVTLEGKEALVTFFDYPRILKSVFLHFC